MGLQLKYRIALLLICGCLAWLISGLFVPDGERNRDTIFGTADVGSSIALQELGAEERTVVRVLPAGVYASQSVDVAAQAGGKVEEVFLESGSFAEKDQVILKLEERERLEALEYAKELLEQRRQEYDAAESLGFTGHSTQMQEQAALVSLKAAEVGYKNALLAYRNSAIRAPFSGIIDRIMSQVGSMVAEGQPVVRISNFDKLKVVTYVSERDISHVNPGDEVKVILNQGVILAGDVCFVGRVATPETMSYRVEALLDNEEGGIFASDGMNASVELALKKVRSYKIPASSLSITDTGAVGIKVLASGGVVSFVDAEIVDDDSEGNVWVTGDFVREDRITLVMRGHEYVTDGMKIPNHGT
ncbi:efflux RND transporter periplasmic adaptor subunit [Anaplasma platys]|uniref:efflux RND transporter periplasmic adaptor subunit n=1 Tax=Anaplasma platys TaxID=949 RepID=UPI00145CA0A4|nr:efflux RND transporter periplasmic adaptor subunit [Anaplasma platys]